jgi:hypothetical protein
MRPILAFDAQESEMPEAAFQQVVGAGASDRRVIHVNQRKTAIGHDAQDIDCGQTNGCDGASDLPVLDASNDAVPLPGFQPAGNHFLQAAGLVINGPRSVLTDVAGHAAQNIAAGC